MASHALIGSRIVGSQGTCRDTPAIAYLRRYAALGVATEWVAIVAVVIYLLATPDGPHRGLIEICALVGAVLTACVAVVSRRFIGSPSEARFFYSWVGATLVLIFCAAQLDGGLNSPLSWLLILPVMWSSINFPVPATTVVAGAAFLGALALMVINGQSAGDDWFRVLCVVMFDVIGVASTANRRTYETAERELAHRATHDGLTGCLNNAAFFERLQTEDARARRTSRPFSVIVADADALKALNDTNGHAAGDAALQAVAAALARATRLGDEIGRLGGDEFGVLLPETTMEAAAGVAGRIQEVLHHWSPATATLSLGVAVWDSVVESAVAPLWRADQAMYEAKRRGGDRVVVWVGDAAGATSAA